eukprot:evm.model.scf_119EXC.8 EVM.evm.TU.scf_119EXC.8   scf_119EXC:62742-63992(+)
MPSSGRDRWILRAPKQANPTPGSRLRLFCFPPAGTGAWAYHGWGPGLPADIEILPVELPGRNSRAGEPAMEAMAPLVAEVVEAVTPLMRERPFVLFGHSMGAWVAYEVALALARAGGPTPAKVGADSVPACGGWGDVDRLADGVRLAVCKAPWSLGLFGTTVVGHTKRTHAGPAQEASIAGERCAKAEMDGLPIAFFPFPKGRCSIFCRLRVWGDGRRFQRSQGIATPRLVCPPWRPCCGRPISVHKCNVDRAETHPDSAQAHPHAGPLCTQAYFSGCRPPHLNGAEHDVDPTRLGDLTYKEFWPAFEKRYGKVPGLEEEIIREYVYPVLRADFRLVEAYQPTGGPVQEGGGLPCPIAALCGEEDGRLHRAQLELWKCHTKAGFQEVWFPNSDHRYISDHPDKLLQFLSKDLTTLL